MQDECGSVYTLRTEDFLEVDKWAWLKENQNPEHSPLGASIAERWMNCPGSVAASIGAGSTTNKFAAEGTLAHRVAACKIRHYLGIEDDYNCSIGSHHVVDGFEFDIDESFLDSVYVYVFFIQGLIEQYGINNKWSSRVEQSIHIPSDSDLLWGQGDYIGMVLFDRIIIADLKFGRGKRVVAKDNPQLKFYGLGAFYSCSESAREGINTVDMYIFQPRHPDGIPIQKYSLSVGDLKAFEVELLAAEARITPDAPRKGGKWCEWCPAEAMCVERLDYIDTKLPVKLSDFPSLGALPQAINLSVSQIATILNHEDMINSWFKSLRSWLHKEQDAGRLTEAETGMKFVEKMTHRKWINENQVEKLLVENGFHSDELKTEPKLKSPNQIESAVKKAKKQIDLTPYWEKPKGEKVLVPVDSARQAVENTVGASGKIDLTKIDMETL